MDEYLTARSQGWAYVDTLINRYINELPQSYKKRAMQEWAQTINHDALPIGAYIDLHRWKIADENDTRPIGWEALANRMAETWQSFQGDPANVVSHSSLYRFADGTRSRPKMETLEYIRLTLGGIDPQMLYVLSGYAMPAPEIAGHPVAQEQFMRLFSNERTVDQVLRLLAAIAELVEQGKEHQLVALTSMAVSMK